jgi:hypothetical protein
MQFRIKNKAANTIYFKRRLIYEATYIALHHKILPSELKLNSYLLKTYNKDLKVATISLIKNCKVLHNFKGEIIIIFPDREDDKLATLITYGNLEFGGSDILKDVFFRKE